MFDLFYPAGATNTGRSVIKSLQFGANRAGIDARTIERYEARPGATLMTFGMGGPDRLSHCRAHPGSVVAWDLGYWQRDGEDKRARMYRVSIDGMHCPERIMGGRCPGPGRFESAGLPTGDACDPQGFILLVGNTPKSIYATGASRWTANTARSLRLQFPGRRVLYRPKPGRPPEPGIDHDGVSDTPIDEALRGCALVVCRHSNVAVDACRWRVPVICTDGAAAAIYPYTFDGPQPDDAKRIEFLHRLAWWQWSRREMEDGSAWAWLRERLQ